MILATMDIDRGFERSTIVTCDVDVSNGVAGATSCIECGGDGNWGKFLPEPAFVKCVECKGTGTVWVSI